MSAQMGAAAPAASQQLVVPDTNVLRQELDFADPASLSASPQADPRLAQQAEAVVARMLQVDLNDHEGRERTKAAVEAMGARVQKEAAHRSQMLKQPLQQMMKSGEEGGAVATSLVELKMKVEDLDPARVDLQPGMLLRWIGKIPGVGTPIKRYFSRFQSAAGVIDGIILALKNGQEQLKRDNLTLAEDQKALRALTLKLQEMVKFGLLIDQKLRDGLGTEVPESDPRHQFVAEELMFPLRQRIQDLQQQLLVTQQGYLTTEMLIRNNKELIRGVNRALDVTVSALQVAVTLALALANQKIVLEKIQAVTATTESLIAGTAQRLRQQGAEIHKQAAGSMLGLETLKAAFTDVRGALDDISRFRQEALPKMAQNILEMDRLADQSEQQIKKIERAERAAGDFPIEVLG